MILFDSPGSRLNSGRKMPSSAFCGSRSASAGTRFFQHRLNIRNLRKIGNRIVKSSCHSFSLNLARYYRSSEYEPFNISMAISVPSADTLISPSFFRVQKSVEVVVTIFAHIGYDLCADRMKCVGCQAAFCWVGDGFLVAPQNMGSNPIFSSDSDTC